MSQQVICLSDSDDEHAEFVKYRTGSSGVDVASTNDRHETDFDFPPINFHYIADNSTHLVSARKEAYEVGKKFDASTAASAVSPNFESRDDNVNFEVRTRVDFSKDREIAAESRDVRAAKKSKKSHERQVSSKNDAEKIRTKEQAAVEKRLLALEKQNRKNMQPGECLKFMKVRIDEGLKNFPFYTEILQTLGDYEISHETVSHAISHCVTWTRRVETHYVDGDNEICKKTKIQEEKHILIVRTLDEIVEATENEMFVSTMASFASLFPEHRLTLVVWGAEEYFERSKKKSAKYRSERNDRECTKKLNNPPRISRYDLEYALADVQLAVKCSSIPVDTSQDLAMTVYRFTKSIAETPFKLERRRIGTDKLDWYAMGDNRDTVRVDKNGNGLKRLWQQQLCQFNLATLETAEAICSVYPSPRVLMEAYENCIREEGEKLLKDIPIRRAAGPLTTARKIGRELSKKIYIMFTSEDGEERLC